jgi:hypothetical protein
MRFDRPSSSDRRGDAGLRFDPASGHLTLGEHETALGSAWGNRTVLEAYVDLAARARGDRLTAMVDVRQADVDALANSLDLDADDLASLMEEVLGATREEAVKLVARLREYRLIGGIAAAATGAAVAGAIVVGVMGAPAGQEPAPAPAKVAAASMRTSSPVQAAVEGSPDPTPDPAAITTTPEGVGLIPAIEEDADGTGLIAPETVDRPAN